MKKVVYTVIVLMALNLQLFGQRPLVENIVDMVSADSIFKNIALLEKMERLSTDNDPDCVHHLSSFFHHKGFDTTFLQYYTKSFLPNIVAIKYGSLYPDSIYVLGAHYDSFERGAPAADDNASGTAGVIEAARILSDYNFEKTIALVLFSGEEMGFVGSKAFSDSLVSNNTKILGMINLDMISYVSEGDSISVSICFNNRSLELMNTYIKAVNSYVPDLKYVVDSTSMIVSSSDHSSFWSNDIPAISLIDEIDIFSDHFNHHIHSNNDIIGLSANSELLAGLITKSVVATLIDLLKIIEYRKSRELE